MGISRRHLFGWVAAVLGAPAAEVVAAVDLSGLSQADRVKAEWHADWDRAAAAVAANERDWISWCEFVFTDNKRRLSREEAREAVCRLADRMD